MTQLAGRSIAESSSRTIFLEMFDTLITNHDNVAANHLPDSIKTSLLQAAVWSDMQLTNSWNVCTEA